MFYAQLFQKKPPSSQSILFSPYFRKPVSCLLFFVTTNRWILLIHSQASSLFYFEEWALFLNSWNENHFSAASGDREKKRWREKCPWSNCVYRWPYVLMTSDHNWTLDAPTALSTLFKILHTHTLALVLIKIYCYTLSAMRSIVLCLILTLLPFASSAATKIDYSGSFSF